MSIYDSLNNEQQEAVMYTEGPLLILAGAGSGKTRVLTHRIAYLIEEKEVKPWNIMAITFTNKAAKELTDRLDSMLGSDMGKDVWASTFHATCARMLRRNADRMGYTSHFTIRDTDDTRRLMKECYKTLDIDDKVLPIRSTLSEISRAKDQLASPGMYLIQAEGDGRKKKIAQAYALYQKRLQEADAMDFDDLLMQTVIMLEQNEDVLEYYQNRFHYIMVDEYQDTNEVQNAIFQAVSRDGQNIFTVGDVKQSIYRFRLADPTIFLEKYNRFPSWETQRWESGNPASPKNFRSRREILDAANFIFSNILSAEMGEMDYGEDEALHFGAEYYPERRDCATEFHLITAWQKSAEGDQPVKRLAAEARFVAERIRQLLDEGYPVTDGDGTLRPCRPEDIVILMRSPGSRSAAFAGAGGAGDPLLLRGER